MVDKDLVAERLQRLDEYLLLRDKLPVLEELADHYANLNQSDLH